jgi:hypothetical protein
MAVEFVHGSAVYFPGFLFVVGLVFATVLAAREKRVQLPTGMPRWGVVIAMISGAWVLALFTVTLLALNPTIGMFGPYIGPASGGIITAAAMRILTYRWSWEGAATLTFSGPLTVEALGHSGLIVLLGVGQLLFGLACGYWIVSASRADVPGTAIATEPPLQHLSR